MKGHIRRRGRRSWAIVIDVGRDPNGKRRQRWHTVQGTKRDAERELARLVHSLNTGEYVEPNKLTVAEYLQRWLVDYAKPNTSTRTHERYAEIVRVNINPVLGHHKLTALQPLHIQDFYSNALTSGRRLGPGGLSAQTVLHFHRLLHGALRQAVRWQLLVRNPVEAVEPPRVKRREMRVLTEAETAQLLTAADGTRVYVPVLVGLTTGMRRGEIVALKWPDVDMQAATLTVTKSIEQSKSGLAVKSTKTAKGRRTITLPSITVEALRRHKADQGRERFRLGPAYQDQDWVCADPDGSVLKPNSLSAAFQLLLRNRELTRIRFHDLRHTHVSQLLQQGVHPKIVAERLGHSTIVVTLDTYSHVVPGLQEQVAQQLDQVLRKALRTLASR